MTGSEPPHDLAETPEQAAARWFARRRSGRMSAQEAQALELWLAEDPEHRALFDQAEYWWGAAGALRADPSIMGLRESVSRRYRRPRPRALAAYAAAAALTVAVIGGWAGIESGTFAAWFGEQSFRTGVGQTATVKLSDGSVVTLDTDTRLRARRTSSQRLLYLDRGQAFFKVAHDRAHPFIVAVGGKTVTATGTAFSVRLDARAVQVTLVEGSVRVAQAGAAPLTKPGDYVQSTEMKAGSRLVAAQDRHWSLTKINTVKAVSWMEGQLIFENRPMSEVAAEMNRYSDKKIVIDDPAVASEPITGAFAAGDVAAFVSAVRAYRLAEVASDSNSQVQLASP